MNWDEINKDALQMRADHVAAIKAGHFRIGITGPPESGKSTLGETIGLRVQNTDNLLHLGWDAGIDEGVAWLSDPNLEVIEGAMLPYSLRRWLRANKTGAPLDRAIFLGGKFRKLSALQEGFGKAVRTVWEDIVPELEKRGVSIVDRGLVDPAEALFNDVFTTRI